MFSHFPWRRGFETETEMKEDGKLTIEHLPFRAGERVEVVVVAKPGKSPRQDNGPKPEDRYPLRGKLYQFHDPFTPVAAEDWDALK